MNILVIAATEAEIGLLIKHLTCCWKRENEQFYHLNGKNVQFAITGIGSVATAYNLTKMLAKQRYDLVIQAGIAGSFDRQIALGDVVLVKSDQFADMGAEDKDEYIDVFEIGLVGENDHPFTNKLLRNDTNTEEWQLPAVTALTVNTVTGREYTVDERSKRYNCQLESMEGAAFHYVCISEGMPFIQIRAVSNYIEPRNRDAWQIGKAVTALNETLINYLEKQ
jgi:futalosine hydrolase